MSRWKQYKDWVNSLSRGRKVAFMLAMWCVAAVIGVCIPLGYFSWRDSRPVQIPEILSRRLATEYLIIHTDLPQAEAKHYASFFDGFYRHFSKRYFQLQQSRKLNMLLFNEPKHYEEFGIRNKSSGTPFGYYMGPQKNAIVVNLQRGLGTVTHELVHHFLAVGQIDHHADWINEGIPTFFEKFMGHVDDKGDLHISFGYFSDWRFPLTQANIENLRLEDLFQTEDQCIARSFMLFLHRRGHLQKFVREIHKQGKSARLEAILVSICQMPLQAIEQEWKQWVANQPIDENVKLVPAAFVKNETQWAAWWKKNMQRLVWDDTLGIYVVRPETNGQQNVPPAAGNPRR
jgi:hypothetical protein